MQTNYPSFSNCAYAYEPLNASAIMREQVTDFQVDEVLGFAPDDTGDHFLIQIRKQNTNTNFVAEQLTRFAGVKQVDVSFAGLKDRHAITSQWFSIKPQPKQAPPNWFDFAQDNIDVLAVHAHKRKLRRGQLKGNRFRLTLRQVSGENSALEQRLEQIKQHGVPNYFAEQRFGRQGNNLDKAHALFSGTLRRVKRQQRSLYISAARSFLFNQILSSRLSAQTWQQPQQGDVLQLSGSHSVFAYDAEDSAIAERLSSGDVSLTGALWGDGESMATAEVAALEQTIATKYPVFIDGLASARLKPERRALSLRVPDLSWTWIEGGVLVLEFYLPAGAYATAVLRELCAVSSDMNNDGKV